MRRLCLGGSFNPVHYGHLRCARAAAIKLNYQQVVLIPSGQPPHKRSPAHAAILAAASDRLAMCRLAAQSEPDGLFAVDDLELHRSAPSYTIDTADELRTRGWGDVEHGGRIVWLIGADMLNDLPTWHRSSQLPEQVYFVVIARSG